MKKSIKLIATAAAAVFISLSTTEVSAQEPAGDSRDTRLGIGLNLGLPTTNGYDFVVGGDLRLQKDFFSNVSGTLSLGYNSYSLENETPNLSAIGVIPLKAGVKIFPTERFYFAGELGAGFNATDKDKLGVDPGTAFVYSAGIGIGFNNGIDLGLRYEGLSREFYDPGMVALRIAYGFNLSR